MPESRAEAIWRPATCQYIEGEPTADDQCKCRRPVWRPGAAFCWQHHKLVYRREWNPRDDTPASGDDGGETVPAGIEPAVSE